MNFLNQYRGLRKELYVLFWGRLVTAMGGAMWPMMTLILKDKMNYTSSEAANIIFIVGLVQLPCILLGGKLADHFDKRNFIVFCDLVTVTGFLLCAFLPMNTLFLVVFCISGIFAQVEWPGYDALVANLSTIEERERAYSLNYMGVNLGFVLAPSITGILFENHLSTAFIISSAATFSSTVLIFFFIKDTAPSFDKGEAAKYEIAKEGATTREIFSSQPVLLLFVICMGLVNSMYNVGAGFMVPLSLENIFGSRGAVIFGTLTSTNGIVVILGVPLATALFIKVRDTSKIFTGAFLQMTGFCIYVIAGARLPVYYLGMVVFTLGEVMLSLGHKPYITKRVPSSHRGRISSVIQVSSTFFQAICLLTAGQTADKIPLSYMWAVVLIIEVAALCFISLLKKKDREAFPLLYKQ